MLKIDRTEARELLLTDDKVSNILFQCEKVAKCIKFSIASKAGLPSGVHWDS